MRKLMAAASLAAMVVALDGCATNKEVMGASSERRMLIAPKYRLAIAARTQIDVQDTDPPDVPVVWKGPPSSNDGSLWYTAGTGENSVFQTKAEDDGYNWKVVLNPQIEGDSTQTDFAFTLKLQRADQVSPYASEPPPEDSNWWKTIDTKQTTLSGGATKDLEFRGSTFIEQLSWVRFAIVADIDGTSTYDCGGPCVLLNSGSLTIQGAIDAPE